MKQVKVIRVYVILYYRTESDRPLCPDSGCPCFTLNLDSVRSPITLRLTLSQFHSWLLPPLCLLAENEPPVLQSLPDRLRSFQGEDFSYLLQARDPEGSVVLFSLDSAPWGASLSPAGLLTWKATVETSETHTFKFTVTDECNTETRASFQVKPLCRGNCSLKILT